MSIEAQDLRLLLQGCLVAQSRGCYSFAESAELNPVISKFVKKQEQKEEVKEEQKEEVKEEQKEEVKEEDLTKSVSFSESQDEIPRPEDNGCEETVLSDSADVASTYVAPEERPL